MAYPGHFSRQWDTEDVKRLQNWRLNIVALISMSPRYSGGPCAGLLIGVPVSLQRLGQAFLDIGNQFSGCEYVEAIAPSCTNDGTSDRVEFWHEAG